MDTFLIYWNKFVQSNTFNFIVMLCILYWIAKKFNISGMLESFRSHVINSIKQAQANKEKAKLELNSAKDSIAGLEDTITEQLKNADKQAEDVAKNIIMNAQKKAQQIELNADKLIKAEEKIVSAKLAAKTAKASAALSKKHIIDLLKANPELHKKFIEQSIQELG
jgi:hypothetical protein